MRNLAIFGNVTGLATPPTFPVVEIDGMQVRSGIVQTPQPTFSPSDPSHAHAVLARVIAFSCNFRDKAFMVPMQTAPASRFFVLGSEFVGRIEAVGEAVRDLAVGDRVIGDNHYLGTGLIRERPDGNGAREGIATNHASREYQVLHEKKVVRIPACMPDDVAASFSLGAQTAYSMVRKAAPAPGAKVLVTAATSNTSLHLIAALRVRGAEVHALTTSAGHASKLRDLGAGRVEVLERGSRATGAHSPIHRLAREAGWFDSVFDPFFDLHLEQSLDALAPSGRYVTCGFMAQNSGAADAAGVQPLASTESVLQAIMLKNLTIIGNCIGLRGDLEQAMADYEQERTQCVVDSVFSGDQSAEFLDRSFNSRSRFGKVVFRYDPA